MDDLNIASSSRHSSALANARKSTNTQMMQSVKRSMFPFLSKQVRLQTVEPKIIIIIAAGGFRKVERVPRRPFWRSCNSTDLTESNSDGEVSFGSMNGTCSFCVHAVADCSISQSHCSSVGMNRPRLTTLKQLKGVPCSGLTSFLFFYCYI